MRTTATYEKVLEAYNILEAQGIPTTVKNIRNITGGSNTTILEHLKTIEERKFNEKKLGYSISQKLEDALKDEALNVSNHAKAAITYKLEALSEREKEITEILMEMEILNQKLKHDLTSTKQQKDDLEKEVEHNRIASHQDITNVNRQLEELKQDKNLLQKDLDAKTIEITKLNMQLDHAKETTETTKRNSNNMKKLLADQRLKSSQEKTKLALSEEKNISFSQKVESCQDRINELKTEQVSLRDALNKERNLRSNVEKELATALAIQKNTCVLTTKM